jgi:hypothetical protein
MHCNSRVNKIPQSIWTRMFGTNCCYTKDDFYISTNQDLLQDFLEDKENEDIPQLLL